ncbi:MAG TPA: glycosyltransferase [Candidatus Merdicola faecigallinarum]|uniref:Glycosyltransferase n=1 Tax=Candidatus Merdicola faecigallinarum TaxID=2840862 RepID=A0A9D1M1X8_9FIRM|nr:glycosyltransferase [Candidatus Merdicola faecigallinarum]
MGEERKRIENEVRKLNLEKQIFFLGIRKDIGELLSAMDIFILPSLYEGAPLSLIEAQTNGIDSVVTKNISKEVLINPNVIPLELNEEKWIKKVQEILQRGTKIERRETFYKNIRNEKYDSKETTELFQEKYYDLGVKYGSTRDKKQRKFNN